MNAYAGNLVFHFVSVPPRPPKLFTKDGALLTTGGTLGPINQGDPLTLICKSNGGKPRVSCYLSLLINVSPVNLWSYRLDWEEFWYSGS